MGWQKKAREFWKFFCLQMTYLGEERVCLGDHELGKTVQINYKMNFIQDNSQKFSLHFKSTFHWLLQVHCTTIKMDIYFSRISFSLDHSSVSWDRTFLYFFSSTVIYFGQKKPIIKCRFWDFRVLGQNSPNSSCHFSKHKLVPPQIIHNSSVLWHITPLYFFGSNCIFLSLVALKCTKSLKSFLEPRVRFFFKFCIIFQCHDT